MKCNNTLSCQKYIFNSKSLTQQDQFSQTLYNLLLHNDCFSRSIVIVCIGTDRATGDSLGPLIGYKLTKYNLTHFNIVGTLENPVHAKNIDSSINTIYNTHNSPLIIAIDASLGYTNDIGNINIGEGPLYPGTGVNKKLTPIGDIHITGTVNVSGLMDIVILQNTRLSLVMRLADFIANGLLSVDTYLSMTK